MSLPVDASNRGADVHPACLNYEPHPLLLAAMEAFRRDLPGLLRDHPLSWVAYHRDARIAVGIDQFDVFEECLRRGYRDGEFLVQCVVEEPAEIQLCEV